MQIRLRPVEAGEGDVKDGGAEDEPGKEAKVGGALELALAAGELGAGEAGDGGCLADAEGGLATAEPGGSGRRGTGGGLLDDEADVPLGIRDAVGPGAGNAGVGGVDEIVAEGISPGVLDMTKGP